MLTMVSHVAAQYGNVWAFGGSAGIDFNSSPPISFKTNIGTSEGSASICDVEGNLLFYTDGFTIWDRYHKPMPNGTDLSGLGINITSSTTQGALIVPIPGKATEYYVFSLGAYESGMVGRLYYCIVDMALNNGMGDVLPGKKSKLLASDLTEQMTAISGRGCNTWLLVASRLRSEIRSYSVTFDGIDTVPVISPKVTGAGGWGGVLGTLDASPDRTKIAFAQGNLVLYDFNARTGSVTNPVLLESNSSPNLYGVAFSPDNSKLYATANDVATYQFDLSLRDTNRIKASKTELKKENVFAIKRGPDGKIYIAVPGTALSVITKPNLAGTACDYQVGGFPLVFGQSGLGLPNVATVVVNKKNYSSRNDTVICADSIVLMANNMDAMSYRWQDGSLGKTFKTDTSGIYWVTYQNYTTECEDYIDTFHLVFHKNRRIYSTTNLDAMCTADTFLLRSKVGNGTSYFWEDQTMGREKVIRKAGIYWVNYRIDSVCELYWDTFNVQYPENNYPLSFTVDTLFCVGTPVNFRNTSNPLFNRFQWSFGDGQGSTQNSPQHQYNDQGVYEAKLVGWIGDKCADSVMNYITVDSVFPVRFRMDKDRICQGEMVDFYADVDRNIVALYWNYGVDDRLVTTDNLLTQHAFPEAGSFPITLTAFNRVCPETHYTDTLEVQLIPNINLGPDTTLCWQGRPLLLENNALLPAGKYKYLWNTGETTASIKAVHHGMYSLRITTDDSFGCTNKETIDIAKDCYIDIPNAFTPNADGFNDFFFPRQILSNGITSFRMEIFDRWGQKIFQTTNEDGRGWDGKLNGQDQPNGVYVYQIQLEFTNGAGGFHEGNITLIR